MACVHKQGCKLAPRPGGLTNTDRFSFSCLLRPLRSYEQNWRLLRSPNFPLRPVSKLELPDFLHLAHISDWTSNVHALRIIAAGWLSIFNTVQRRVASTGFVLFWFARSCRWLHWRLQACFIQLWIEAVPITTIFRPIHKPTLKHFVPLGMS
jgi:hypothetical protein